MADKKRYCTIPQFRYRPSKAKDGVITEWIVESVVYGDHFRGPYHEHVNFVAEAATEYQAITICMKLMAMTLMDSNAFLPLEPH